MKSLRLLMGMPIAVEILDEEATPFALEAVFRYFASVERTFSVYREDSEISRINRGEIDEDKRSMEMKEIFALAEETKRLSDGYFDIRRPTGEIDPSGIVKGWAIRNAGRILDGLGFHNFLVEAGGDIEVRGHNGEGREWRVGIRNPFDKKTVVKVLLLSNRGVATSGTYLRGQHIYNPHEIGRKITDIVSLTVIGPDAYEADRFATAAFAMGKRGIEFIERLDGFEGYMIDARGRATITTGFPALTLNHAAIHR